MRMIWLAICVLAITTTALHAEMKENGAKADADKGTPCFCLRKVDDTGDGIHNCRVQVAIPPGNECQNKAWRFTWWSAFKQSAYKQVPCTKSCVVADVPGATEITSIGDKQKVIIFKNAMEAFKKVERTAPGTFDPKTLSEMNAQLEDALKGIKGVRVPR